MSFYTTYQPDLMEQLLNKVDKNDLFYCYCGGKPLEKFIDENNILKIIEKINEKKKIDPQVI